ncbi:acyltransferase 3 [Actinobacteria bacterium OK074]|nr:acyltransferase 3 [Actinobacteria bacterium OK074]
MGRMSSYTLGRRPQLDGLRGVAVLLVMLTHTKVLPWGYVGLDVFFVLSGFLITTLLYEEGARSGRIDLRRFYARRARRLLPALAVLLTAYAAVRLGTDLLGGHWSLRHQLLTTLLFANNWVVAAGRDSVLGALSPTWSLAEEEQFYVLWPVVVWGLLRLRRPRIRPRLRLPLRVLALLAVTLTVIAALLLLVPHTPPGAWAHSHRQGYFDPFNRATELLLGCATALLWRLRPVALPGAAQLPLLLAAFTLAWHFDGFRKDESVRWAAALAALALLTTLAVEHGTLTRLLKLRPLRYAGRISYGLYLYHWPLATMVGQLFPWLPRPAYVLATFALSFALAAASWHFLESRFLHSRKPEQPAAPPTLPAPQRYRERVSSGS